MHCPFCFTATNKSVVVEEDRGKETTIGMIAPLEINGALHVHDPNRFSTRCTCPNGHVFDHCYCVPCPTCGAVAKPATLVLITSEKKD